MGLGHGELTDLNQVPGAGIEHRAPAHPEDLEIDPEVSKMLIEPVALGEPPLERCRLQSLARGESFVAIFRLQIRYTH